MAIKIMLDAGHYGNYNQSPVCSQYWESKQMWTLHLLLKEYLEENYEVKVDVTRVDQSKDLEVTKRGSLAKGYDLFISLHSNAASSQTVDRVEVYASYNNINNSHVLGKQLADAVAETMGVSGGYVKTRKSEKGNWEYYGVLRGAHNSGCPLYYLIEHSFHTNKGAAEWLISDDNLRKLAKVEAEVIAKYYGLKEKYTLGDVNQDGKVNVFDVAILKGAIMDNYKLSEKQSELADVNQDGKINIFDYLALKQSIMTSDAQPAFKVGDQVKINKDATTYSDGKKISNWVKEAVLYVRKIESDGNILLLSTEKDAPEYTGRFKVSDVYKI